MYLSICIYLYIYIYDYKLRSSTMDCCCLCVMYLTFGSTIDWLYLCFICFSEHRGYIWSFMGTT